MVMCLINVMNKMEVDIVLLLKYFKCETTRTEELEILHWLSDDSDGLHRKKYIEARALFEGLTIYSDMDDFFFRSGRKFKVKKALFAALRIAAVVAIIFIVGMVSRRTAMNSLSNQMETIVVPAGKSMNMILADGTKIWLNSGTEIEMPVIFAKKIRRVKLNSGEVLFEVKKDSDRPFVVDTYAGDITVLGTKFNVMVDADRDYFSASLLDGKVKVHSKGKQSFECILNPNETVSRHNQVWSTGFIKNAESVICWTEGLVNVADMSFEDIMRKLEKTFDVDIVVERMDVPVTHLSRGKIRVSDGIENALQVLAMAFDFKYEMDDNSGMVYIR